MFPMIISVLYLLWVIGAMIQMEDDDRWLYFVFLSPHLCVVILWFFEGLVILDSSVDDLWGMDDLGGIVWGCLALIPMPIYIFIGKKTLKEERELREWKDKQNR